MTTLADRTVTALRSVHDDLAALVPDLTAEQLAGPSGASEWSIAQVLSHLGSGAEIARAGYVAALEGAETPGQDFNQTVWDRWNALEPADQATAFLQHDTALLETLEALTDEQRESVQIKLGFLPAPLPLASALGMRLNEATLHSWDVHVGIDPAATLDPAVSEVLVEHFTGGLGFLLGFSGKADQLAEPALVAVEHAGVAVAIEDQVSLVTSTSGATAAFSGESEALLRLIGGRLTAPYTPADVTVTGNVGLDDLRRVFPGY